MYVCVGFVYNGKLVMIEEIDYTKKKVRKNQFMPTCRRSELIFFFFS